MDALNCGWDAARFLIFSDNVFEPLIYYSHLGPLIASLLIGAIVLLNDPRALINRTLFVVTAAFSTWVYFDLILWASEKPEYIMFFWSAIVPVELLIYASAWYLVALLSNGGKPPSMRELGIAAATFIPIFALAHTSYNLLGYDFSNCDRAAIEGPLIQYMYVVELFFIIWIASLAIQGYQRMRDGVERHQLVIISLGVLAFLLAFSVGNVLVFAVYAFEFDWSYEQYKLFGMPILAALITYSAIRFKTFNLKVITAQALVVAVGILVFSLLFLQDLANVRTITAITFALVCVLGYILVRNVRREIEQRELIEKQEKELELANRQQETLLHFISHEIKGYLTKSEAGFASIVEGDFGAVGEPVKNMAKNALGEVRKGVATVMDILSASNLKKGTVRYKKERFDLKKAVLQVVDELRPSAENRGLSFDVVIGEGKYDFEGDEHKIRDHVVRNLIDNAIKYTPKGMIEVRLTDLPAMPAHAGQAGGDPSTKLGAGKLRFSVKDNGVGITSEDMRRLFTEGGHGKDSLKVNVDSTGYGLFIAKQIVEAHGGRIWAESEGQDKGARFLVELPTLA